MPNRRLLFIPSIIFFILAAAWPGILAQELPFGENRLDKNWSGLLKVSGIDLQIIFKISSGPGKTLQAAMDVPLQGAKDIPVDKISFENGRLHLEITAINGIFEGKVNDVFTEIDGQWTQSGMSFPLLLKPIETLPQFNRPQEPKRPLPYDEEEAFFENKKAAIKLAGTLTLPKGNGPFPVVLLITGSGAQNRDEELLGHRPFLVLSDYLTRRGLAVLRFDDRGVGQSTGDFSKATSLDFAGDVKSGIAFLKNHPRIDPKKIGLLGHSEGGIIAPLVAAESADVSFIVMLAGTGLTGDKIILLQSELISRADGEPEEQIKNNLEDTKKTFAVLKSENDQKKAEEEITRILGQSFDRLSEEYKKQQGITRDMIKTQVQTLFTPWLRFFLSYDPLPALKKVKCPVLALNGGKDLQVPPGENLAAIEKALKDGGNLNYVIKELAGLNHLFQTANSGSPVEYIKIDETISPVALQIIGDWIVKQTGAEKND